MNTTFQPPLQCHRTRGERCIHCFVQSRPRANATAGIIGGLAVSRLPFALGENRRKTPPHGRSREVSNNKEQRSHLCRLSTEPCCVVYMPQGDCAAHFAIIILTNLRELLGATVWQCAQSQKNEYNPYHIARNCVARPKNVPHRLITS